MPFHLIEDLSAAVGKALGLTNKDKHDAAAQPSNIHPTSQSCARGSKPSSRVVVDLSSPTKPARSPQRLREAASSRPRPPRARKSEDELRLVGDFSTPADAVACPDPQSWNPSSHMAPTPTMKKKSKPGAGDAFRPINTLTGSDALSRRSRQITYGKQSRPLPQTIGHAQYGGQRAYLESATSRIAAATARDHALHASLTDGTRGPSPAKRRKTEHVIEIDGDDESQHVSPSRTPQVPVMPPHGIQSAGPRSQSQVSVGSGTSFTATQRSSQPQSEFRATDRRLLQHRKSKPRHPTSARSQIPHGAFSVDNGTVTSPSRGTIHSTYVLSDDEEAPPRRHLFETFEQGVAGSSQRRAIVTSKHFPNARINESTSEFSEPSTGIRSALLDSANLRDAFRPPPRETEGVDDSPDELAMSPTQPRVIKSKVVHSKAVQAANNAVQHRKRMKSDGERGWQLRYARSLDFELQEPGLRLKYQTDTDYGIQKADKDHNYYLVDRLELSRVSKIDADTVSRIRLVGGRGQDGNVYTVDLEFANTEEFLQFRDNYAMPFSGLKKLYKRDEKHMQSMFEKTLPRNDKVGQTSGITEIQAAGTPIPATETRPPLEQNTMLQQLRAHAVGDTRSPTGALTADALRQPTRTSARSTRSSAPSSVLFDMPGDQEEVEKYSVKHGLGPAWKKPLMYGQGKQRATVHFEDLTRLDEEEFLNDSLIDFYMIYLFKQHNVPSDKVYFFNTYFYTALTTDTGRKPMNYAKVARWTQKIDIFGYDYIVVPINELTHWYLAIICNVSSIDRRPVMEDFDDAANTTVDKMQSSNPQDMSGQGMADDRSSIPNGDDPQAFEEASQLNPVDADDPGSRIESPTTNSGYVDGPQHDAVGKGPTNDTIFVPDMETRANPGTVSASQKSKKPKKRQYVPPKRDPNQPVVIILDSLRETRSSAVRALKDWILAEGKARRGMEAIIKENGHYAKATQIPTQSNWSDCGVYLLGYVDKFFQDPDGFKNKLLMGEMSAERDWPEFHPKQMRNHMRKVIFACVKDQEKARSRERRARLGTGKMNALPPRTNEKETQDQAQNAQARPAAANGSQVAVAVGEVLTETSEASTVTAPPRKLDSPFKFRPTSAGLSAEMPPEEAPNNGSYDLVSGASSAKSTTHNSHTKERSRHRSPEVRIPGKSPEQSWAAQAKALATKPSTGESQRLHQQVDLDVSAQAPRHNEDDSEHSAAGSEQTLGTSPQKQGTGESRDPALESITTPNRTPTRSSTNREQTVGSSPNRRTLRAAPSLEEINPSSFHANNARKRRKDANVPAVGNFDMGSGGEPLGTQSPMLMDVSLQRAEEALPDMMDVDSPSADGMDLDTTSRASEVKETPEPDDVDFPDTDREQSPVLM
ncbi:hypothetical protein J1614_000646 [Plenodomus biglobosus]|nr:hypothetical protein J1614_000646 [Plenodomus biglobosus]